MKIESDEAYRGAAACPRVALVEHDAQSGDAIMAPALRDRGFEVAAVGSAAELYRCLYGNGFDIVVLDVGLPDASGFDVAHHLRSTSSIGIVLTGSTGDRDHVRGLEAGADIYLAKPIAVDAVAATLRSLARRLQSAPLRTALRAWHLADDGWQLNSPDGRCVELTAAERTVLLVLLAAAGRPVTREELIGRLAGGSSDFDPHRLEMLIHRLRRKVRNAVGAELPLRTLRGTGYVLTGSGRSGETRPGRWNRE